MARALGVQSREIWQVTTGSLSDQLESLSHFSPLYAAVFQVAQQRSKARHPRYNSHASRSPLCDSHERCFCVWVREHACVCVCVIVGSYSSRNQEQSQEQRCHSAFNALLLSGAAAAAVCLVSHRKLLTPAATE